jgi:hypothetical protein
LLLLLGLLLLDLLPQVSQYLEGYLWPHFDAATASDAHVLSIAVMVNEKFREGVPAWTAFHSQQVRCCCSTSSLLLLFSAFGCLRDAIGLLHVRHCPSVVKALQLAYPVRMKCGIDAALPCSVVTDYITHV